MGWKSVKEEFNITHIVHVKDGVIHIGSPYISDLIRLNQDGSIAVKDIVQRDVEPLSRYIKEMEQSPDRVRKAIEREDGFTKSLTVFTYDYSGNILTLQCEERGWPNVTHDGRLMYDNTFFRTEKEARAKAVREYESGIEYISTSIAEQRQKLAETTALLERYRSALSKVKGEPE